MDKGGLLQERRTGKQGNGEGGEGSERGKGKLEDRVDF